jgi:hypothetical protein
LDIAAGRNATALRIAFAEMLAAAVHPKPEHCDLSLRVLL